MRKTLLLILLGMCLTACSTTVKEVDEYAHQSEQEIDAQGEVALYEKHYSDAIDAFEALTTHYPFGKRAQRAQRHLIYAYFKDNDMLSTISTAEHYIHLYPRSPHVDYAYYMKGIARLNQGRGFLQKIAHLDPSQRDMTDMIAAYSDLKALLRFFPKSQYATDAQKQLFYLRDQLAAHELEVAHFYFQHQTYVAAANRASYIVQHYQHAAHTKEALEVMVHSYEKLHQPKLANQAQRVLNLNFPKEEN